MSGSNAESLKAECPRCGYDLRGVMPTWIESCPREGTCAECGLTYRWAEVLHPEKFEPTWCVEFAKGRRSFARASLGTFMRSFWPWGFWSRVKMAHGVKFRRLFAYAIILIAIMLMPYIVGQASLAGYVRYRLRRQLSFVPAADAQALVRAEYELANLEANFHKVSLWRLWQYTMRMRGQQAWVNDLRKSSQSPPPQIDHSYLAAMIEAVFLPWSSTSRGTITKASGFVSGYPAPNDLLNQADILGAMAVVPRVAVGGFITRPRWFGMADAADALRSTIAALASVTGVVFAVPFALVFLPISRRRSKVRWRHIGRARVYGLFIPTTAVALCSILMFVAITNGRFDWAGAATAVALLLPSALGFAWWWAAISRYLRISHGFLVALLLTTLSSLLVAAIAYYGFGPGREMF
jgi:hypothetical protein